MRGVGIDLLDHPDDLEELVHKALLVLQPAGGVDQHHVIGLGPGLLDRVEGQPGGVGARRTAHKVRARSLGPDLQLLDCSGPEGIAGHHKHPGAAPLQVGGDLAQGGGLARSVHADEQDDVGARAGQGIEPALMPGEFVGDGLGQGLEHLGLVHRLAEPGGGEGLGDPRRGLGAQVRLDQHHFQGVDPGLVEGLLGEGRGHLLGQGPGGPGETAGEALEPTCLGFSHGRLLDHVPISGNRLSDRNMI